MTKAREKAIKMYWGMAKEKCPFQTEEIVNGYLEGFIDCAELFEEEDKLTLTKYSRIIIDKKDECIEELEKKLEQEKKLNEEIKARFVKCNTCTDETKEKCLMFSENLCEGERCEELVDLMALINKDEK